MGPQTQTFYLFVVWLLFVLVLEVQRQTVRVVSACLWGRCVCIVEHVCVCWLYVTYRERHVFVCACAWCVVRLWTYVIVIVSVVCTRATSDTRAYTYLIHVSKKTNTLNIDIDLYRGYMFVYSLYIDTYITELQGNSLIYIRFVYTRIAEQFTYIR